VTPEGAPTGPVLGVSVAAFRDDGGVLAVQRGKPPFHGIWSLPGGAVEPGESVREAARREVLEETGLEAEIGRLVDLHEVIARDPQGALLRHYVIAVFRATAKGVPRAGSDAAQARFLAPAELARLETTPGLLDIVARAAITGGD
jgi:ADP-ribose pyrophosphatase YjhB (NUDIX family)